MSDDFMELNDMELNYIYFDDETDSNDASNNLDKYFLAFFQTETKKIYGFYFTETFILNLFSFSIAENANIVGTAF